MVYVRSRSRLTQPGEYHIMLNPRERLKRLREQKLDLPPYELVSKDGSDFAVFDPGCFLFWEELCPEVFEDFETHHFECGCTWVNLGRMQ